MTRTPTGQPPWVTRAISRGMPPNAAYQRYHEAQRRYALAEKDFVIVSESWATSWSPWLYVIFLAIGGITLLAWLCS